MKKIMVIKRIVSGLIIFTLIMPPYLLVRPSYAAEECSDCKSKAITVKQQRLKNYLTVINFYLDQVLTTIGATNNGGKEYVADLLLGNSIYTEAADDIGPWNTAGVDKTGDWLKNVDFDEAKNNGTS